MATTLVERKTHLGVAVFSRGLDLLPTASRSPSRPTEFLLAARIVALSLAEVGWAHRSSPHAPSRSSRRRGTRRNSVRSADDSPRPSCSVTVRAYTRTAWLTTGLPLSVMRS